MPTNKARLEIIPRGHYSPVECPDILNELIVDFFKTSAVNYYIIYGI